MHLIKPLVREVMLRVFKEIDKQNRQDNLAAYNSLLKQGIKAVKPNAQEVLDWQKEGNSATDHIQKAGSSDTCHYSSIRWPFKSLSSESET
jgi:hypothetical protein